MFLFSGTAVGIHSRVETLAERKCCATSSHKSNRLNNSATTTRKWDGKWVFDFSFDYWVCLVFIGSKSDHNDCLTPLRVSKYPFNTLKVTIVGCTPNPNFRGCKSKSNVGRSLGYVFFGILHIIQQVLSPCWQIWYQIFSSIFGSSRSQNSTSLRVIGAN